MSAITNDGGPEQSLRISQLYAALGQINQAVVRVDNRERLFRDVCKALVVSGGFKMAWIGWRDGNQPIVSVAGQFGDTDEYLADISVRHDDTPEGRGPVGVAIRDGVPSVINDFTAAAHLHPWHAAALRCGFNSIGAFPIRMAGEVCGALASYSSERGFFGPAEIELLSKAADDISFALDYRRMDQVLEERETTLRAFYNGSPMMMGVAELTPDGEIIAVSVNEATARRYHRSAEEVSLLTARQAGMGEEEHAIWLAKYREAEATGQPVRFDLAGDWLGRRTCLSVVVSLIGRTPQGNPRLCFISHDVTERVDAEETIRRQNELYRLVQRATNDAIWDWDLVTGALSWNDAIHTLFGYRPGDVRSAVDWWQDNIHPDDVAEVLAGIERLRAEGRTFWSHEYRFRRHDGSYAYVLNRGHVVHDEFGRAVRMIGAMVDLSGRKRAEQVQVALRQISDAAQLAPTLPELFSRIHEIVGQLLPARNLFVALYDARRDELSFPYYVDEFDAAPAPRALDSGTLAGRVIRLGQALLFTPDTPQVGDYEKATIVGTDSLDWLGVPLKSQAGTIGALVVQSYSGDVRYTEEHKTLLEFVSGQVATAIVRRQSEDALRVSEARFRLLFEQNLAGVFRSLPDGRILECNDAFARMLGYESRAEILPVNSNAFYFDPGDRAQYLDSLRATGSRSNYLTRLRRRDGAEVWCMENVSLVRDELDAPEIIQGTLVDFSERRRFEEALHLSESRLEEAQRLAHLGSWNWDLATQVLSWSDELCRIYGVDPEHHVPGFEDFLARVHDDDRERVRGIVSQALQDRKSPSFELRIVRPDGEVRTIFDQSEVLLDATGRPIGMTGACLDITARKLEEQLEHDRSVVLEQVAQNQPLPEVLANICRMLETQIAHSRCSVLLLKDGHLQTGAAPGLPAGYMQRIEGLKTGPNAGACGTTCHTGLPTITEDIARDPSWDAYRDLAAEYDLRACWSLPIPSNDDGVLGAFALYPDQAGPPTPRALDLLGMAAKLAAVAIEHHDLTDKLSHQAQHDGLTGLPNRLLFQDRLAQALAQAQRNGRQVAVLYMDLDRFKHINDTLGHSSGDALLRQVGNRLAECIRQSDTLARLGGDEFTVVLTDLADAKDAMIVARKLLETMRDPFLVEGRELFTSISLGISIFPTDGADAETLMVNADIAMYRAKDVGRDNFQWFAAEMNARAKDRMDLESQLRHALALGQLSLNYQPQCGAQGHIRGFEALMRWHHPVLGQVPPGRFIPLAEDSGLIVQMGEWALREACAQTRLWRDAGHGDIRIAVNVSAAQFKRADWVDTVRRALRDTGLAPDALELEITESLLLQGVSETSANLIELRNLGVGVAIDDFGTGYSSLSYLHKLPVTTLKIDQSFVRDIGAKSIPGQEDAPIIRTIIALARNFGMSVVAEGVETPAQRELLLRLGCDGLQGYLLHEPLTVRDATELLEGRTRAAQEQREPA
ncbi:bifunctional diguanylate cyclase/phosphodiesterase [Cognatiluteimonas telluris]|uniref:bifunctional diguanylate cyclase/phosphodiesterase n=1 Tax=Cognatiluteimonas telluris TaxID=1104775 RepID=UPI00140B7D5F|nr:EAL domain-containing protein [Lysobacter telluris]